MYKFKIMTWHNIAVKYYGRHFCQVWKKWGGGGGYQTVGTSKIPLKNHFTRATKLISFTPQHLIEVVHQANVCYGCIYYLSIYDFLLNL